MQKFVLVFIYILNFLIKLLKFILWPVKRNIEIKNICIYRIGSIGDIACAIPAINNIRNSFPKAKIHFLSSSGKKNKFNSSQLLNFFHIVDEFIIYNQINYSFLKSLRRKNFDLFVELPSDLAKFSNQIRNILFAYVIKSKKAFGWEIRTLKFQKKFLNKYVNYDNEVIRLNKIVNTNLKKNYGINYNFPFSNTKKEAILNKFKLNDLQFLCVSVGGKRKSNIWPTENYTYLIEKIIDKYQLKILFIGGGEDSIYTDLIMKQIKNDYKSMIYNLIGKTSFIESIYILSKSKCLICNDTGTQHLASICGTKTFSIFSSRDMKNKWYPYGDSNKVFRAKFECLCYEDNCEKCVSYLKDIDPEYVLSSIDL